MIKINNKNIQMPQPAQQPEQQPMDPNLQNPGMTPEEMSADLDQLMQQVHGKYQDFSSQKIQAQNETQQIQEETLNKVFEILASAGVDGTDEAQMNDFLEKLKASSPELYQYFSDAISSLMGGDMSSSGGQPMDNMSSMPPEMGMSGQQ